MIGRDREFARAKSMLDRGGGYAEPILLRVSGPPGVGKSCFLAELVTSCSQSGWFAVSVACHEVQSDSPYVVAIRITAAVLRRLGTDIGRYASGLRDELAALDPGFAALFGMPTQPSGLNQENCVEIVSRLLEGVAADYRVLIACDDAQWIDRQSASVLRALAEHFSMGTLALIGAERSGEHNPAMPQSQTAIDLGPLSQVDAQRLVRIQLPQLPEVAVDTIVYQGRGNPLTLLTLCEDVARNGAAESWSDQSTLSLIAKRIERMVPEEREFLQLCALIGEPIEFRLIFKLYPDARQVARLLEGAARSFLAPDGPDLRFSHHLIADAVSATIEFEVPLRTRIIEALRSIHELQLDEIERLVQQTIACGDRDGAFEALYLLADTAFNQNAWTAVVGACERALSMKNVPRDRFVDFYMRYGVALRSLDRALEAPTMLDNALRLADAADIVDGIGPLVALYQAFLIAIENPNEVFLVYERYRRKALAEADRAPIAAMAMAVAAIVFDAERFASSRNEFLSLSGQSDYARATSLGALATFSTGKGDYDGAMRALAEAFSVADERRVRQKMALEFNKLYATFHHKGCSAIERFLPDISARYRFESDDLFAVRMLDAAFLIATGSWTIALERFESFYRSDMAVPRRAQLLVVPAIVGALTGASTAWDAEMVQVGQLLLAGRYARSAKQFLPWVLARLHQPGLERWLRDLVSEVAEHPPWIVDVAYFPLGLSVWAARRRHSEVLAFLAGPTESVDRSRWAVAHWNLMREHARVAGGSRRDPARARAIDAELQHLDAPMFAALAAHLTGTPSSEQCHLLEAAGVIPGSTRAGAAVVNTKDSSGLTRREVEIARKVGEGLANRQIAESLVLSERTVEVHVSNIFAKVHVSSRAQLVRWLLER
ncbi:MAG TPA: AAA family ATPase [Candidatus Baltobacteraceae bacterium]